MKPYSIIIADDHAILRAGLKQLIDKEESLKVVAEAEDGEELLKIIKRRKCDLIVLDLSMPRMSGIAAIKEIRKKYSKIKILVLTMFKDHDHFRHAMQSGASGYLLKEDAYEQLILAIKMTLKDKQFVSPSVSSLLTDRYVRSLNETQSPSVDILTKRELQILRLIATGLANKNIAAQLKISIRTVETHRSHLSDKLGIKTTAGLVRYAMQKNIV